MEGIKTALTALSREKIEELAFALCKANLSEMDGNSEHICDIFAEFEDDQEFEPLFRAIEEADEAGSLYEDGDEEDDSEDDEDVL